MADKKVFVSYAKPDSEMAEKIRRDLKKNGIEVRMGGNWSRETDKVFSENIGQYIGQSKCFIALLSRYSIIDQRYFQKELGIATEISKNRNNFVIPVRIDHWDISSPDFEMEIIIDMFGGKYEAGLKNLLAEIKKAPEIPEFVEKIIQRASSSTVAKLLDVLVIRRVFPHDKGAEPAPPELNIVFTPQQLPKEGGSFDMFLDPDSDDGEMQKLRRVAIHRAYSRIPFFLDSQENLTGTGDIDEVDEDDPIELDVPANTMIVFIALGKKDELGEVKREFGSGRPYEDGQEKILWAVYGPGKD